MNNWLILGLGNPDKKYEKTKHNVPWWVLDILENKFSKNKQYEKNEKNHFEVRLDFDLYSLYLVYPSTYVNNSGVAMKDLLQKEKFSLEKTIVISDDIRLEEGRLRIRRKGSSGGHNGLNSIINHIGSEEFLRLKIGVGKPHENEDQIKFVLSKVKNFELVNNSCIEAAEACISIIEEGTKTAMEKYNGV
ncbi:MAG: aminoacyl-tRNA hydrolase [Dehalococcoidia bacterium]|nr:aminoacyl-tRNA hydrolase [Chloroflexota bacterium]OUW96404.1 MAG: aminoacyl-tRNA hydrolase [Chloroflexi bacterium TMED230]RZP13304.1 MAG: aminoacyl-tRNA hydrolase [Chloroflexota bacterium]|tara:strand:+ start:161 stop:730 length:570 start_codon:yes stop_codon:yes gene_type:complete